jgi:hypothetical protein
VSARVINPQRYQDTGIMAPASQPGITTLPSVILQRSLGGFNAPSHANRFR